MHTSCGRQLKHFARSAMSVISYPRATVPFSSACCSQNKPLNTASASVKEHATQKLASMLPFRNKPMNSFWQETRISNH